MNLRTIRALIADGDGTLWRGDQPLPGLVTLADFLRRHSLAFQVVTNNSTEPPARYREKLARFGLEVGEADILTAAVATAEYLRQDRLSPGAVVYVIGEVGLREALSRAGFVLAADAGRPVEAVVVGGDAGLTYAKLKDAVLLLQRGAAFIGTNPDLLIPTEEGLVPEAGTTLAALQAATGLRPTVVGKPEPILFDLAMGRMGSRPAETAMLGDRLETDILGAQRAGLPTILVTTGVDDEETVRQKGIEPEMVVRGLGELVERWEKDITRVSL